MTFGKVKSWIEKNLLESYRDSNEFKKILKEFKHNVLEHKNISKIYSIYDQLSTPQGLTEEQAKEFLNEGLDVLRTLLPTIRTPKSLNKEIQNNYKDIDTLAYNTKIQIQERLQSRKNIIKILISEKKNNKETINIPLSSMVNVANQTLKSYVENLDENSKREFFKLISVDQKNLESEFKNLKENAITKLKAILEKENESDIKNKIHETISKIETEKFDQLNFLKMKSLVESI